MPSGAEQLTTVRPQKIDVGDGEDSRTGIMQFFNKRRPNIFLMPVQTWNLYFNDWNWKVT